MRLLNSSWTISSDKIYLHGRKQKFLWLSTPRSHVSGTSEATSSALDNSRATPPSRSIFHFGKFCSLETEKWISSLRFSNQFKGPNYHHIGRGKWLQSQLSQSFASSKFCSLFQAPKPSIKWHQPFENGIWLPKDSFIHHLY